MCGGCSSDNNQTNMTFQDLVAGMSSLGVAGMSSLGVVVGVV
jgi:hypothetical protein